METLSSRRRLQHKQENQITVSDGYFFIRCTRLHVRLNFDDITHIEALANYVKFYTNDQFHLTIITMKKLIEQLPKEVFFRINRSTIINKKWIVSFDRQTVTLKNGKQFSFGEGVWRTFVGQINIL